MYAWQLLRCLHEEFLVDEGQPLDPPTLDELGSMLLQ